MTFSSEFLVRPRKEILNAWEWYEDKKPGLGNRFLDEVEKTLRKIEQNPERYPMRGRKYREAQTLFFPYLIIYRINQQKKIIVVTSVFHAKLNPLKKPSR